MFSGIVKSRAQVVEVKETATMMRLIIEAHILQHICVGDSICVSGVCLTVADKSDSRCAFDLATETRRVTSLGDKRAGDIVNLEPSLRIGEALHGHFVSGHVDAVAEVLELEQQENTWRFVISLPGHLKGLIVPKGSVAIDGVSLTVGEVNEASFAVYIIPFTLEETTFGVMERGSRVNLEVDLIARYVMGILKSS